MFDGSGSFLGAFWEPPWGWARSEDLQICLGLLGVTEKAGENHFVVPVICCYGLSGCLVLGIQAPERQKTTKDEKQTTNRRTA